jgi:hypothetical protein
MKNNMDDCASASNYGIPRSQALRHHSSTSGAVDHLLPVILDLPCSSPVNILGCIFASVLITAHLRLHLL